MYSVGKAAEVLGITYDGALKIMHKLGLGELHGRMFVVNDKELELMKWNCERFTKRHLGEGYVSHRAVRRSRVKA